MTTVIYEIVPHEGGWAYRVDKVYSECFRTHDEARAAAEAAAREQLAPGRTVGITYEDEDGRWHQEISAGTDRPRTQVRG